MARTTLLVVNGTLMRGLELNQNLLKAGAEFVREARTDSHYRLWSVNDKHPGMLRVAEGGTFVDVEVWELPVEGVADILASEPAGLSIGKVRMDDGEELLGVLAEPWRVQGQREITRYGGWRAYIARTVVHPEPNPSSL